MLFLALEIFDRDQGATDVFIGSKSCRLDLDLWNTVTSAMSHGISHHKVTHPAHSVLVNAALPLVALQRHLLLPIQMEMQSIRAGGIPHCRSHHEVEIVACTVIDHNRLVNHNIQHY